ncbi:Gfo/Idh/MocA family protein [Phytoactinopolyspora halophila]|uniref:Gfo/Idh/MocA family protein n=1 Tax=Phytoactinopolyspora halophila TaxID=1981511 RepID=UPI0013148894|nr:Gfo/Idh/MocA family oxidoreductase [Phytoactinopolyspora halophila]
MNVGLVGAGPWASILHAPVWTGGPEATLSAIWARRPEAASELAAEYGTEAVPSFEALLERSDAVAFAVPPQVQWELAVRAARAGKHLILEKPIADSLDHARELASAVDESGVGSMVMFTSRFDPGVRTFLEKAQAFDTVGARGAVITPAFLRGPFSNSPWRHERGALVDVGPHILDMLTAALGPAARIGARSTDRGWFGLHVDHASGAASDVTLSCRIGLERGRFEVELFGPEGALALAAETRDEAAMRATMRTELAGIVQGQTHPCDARRGLYIQALVDAAERSLGDGSVPVAPAEP